MTDSSNVPLNLSGYDVKAQMKRWYTSSNVTTFSVSINTTSGTITLGLDANTTSELGFGRHVYDVDITDGDTISRLVEGRAYVHPGVTNSNVGG